MHLCKILQNPSVCVKVRWFVSASRSKKRQVVSRVEKQPASSFLNTGVPHKWDTPQKNYSVAVNAFPASAMCNSSNCFCATIEGASAITSVAF